MDMHASFPDPQRDQLMGLAGYRNRIIFLGDGTEVVTGVSDADMHDITEEDKDLESQVSKGDKQEAGGAEGEDAAEPAKEASAADGDKPSEGKDADTKMA
jgi:protein phosphatase 2C family protein 2/3